MRRVIKGLRAEASFLNLAAWMRARTAGLEKEAGAPKRKGREQEQVGRDSGKRARQKGQKREL